MAAHRKSKCDVSYVKCPISVRIKELKARPAIGHFPVGWIGRGEKVHRTQALKGVKKHIPCVSTVDG